MPNMNASTVVLIPKVDNANTISQFKQMTIGNFKAKIISKILADKFSFILPTITSQEQYFGESLGIKVDIVNVFDTLE